MYASILLQRLFTFTNITSAIHLAAYVVFQVKEHVDGCGNDTDIVFLDDNGAHWVDRARVRTLENLFREYSHIEAGLLHFMFDTKNDLELDKSKLIAGEIRKLRRAVVKLLR